MKSVPAPDKEVAAIDSIASRIFVIRGHRVMLDSDLAKIYGVPTKRLNEQVRRNRNRFPSDFAFPISYQEVAILRSQIATSSWGGRRKLPWAFTEHGAVMLANILHSSRTVIGVGARSRLRAHRALRRGTPKLKAEAAPRPRPTGRGDPAPTPFHHARRFSDF